MGIAGIDFKDVTGLLPESSMTVRWGGLIGVCLGIAAGTALPGLWKLVAAPILLVAISFYNHHKKIEKSAEQKALIKSRIEFGKLLGEKFHACQAALQWNEDVDEAEAAIRVFVPNPEGLTLRSASPKLPIRLMLSLNGLEKPLLLTVKEEKNELPLLGAAQENLLGFSACGLPPLPFPTHVPGAAVTLLLLTIPPCEFSGYVLVRRAPDPQCFLKEKAK